MLVSKKLIAGLVGALMLVSTTTAQAAVYMGSWDLRGVGVSQVVMNNGNYVSIQNPGANTFRDYTLTFNWRLTGVHDTDGYAGQEMLFNTGDGYLTFVTDRTNSTYKYNVGPNWVLMKITDTDGQPGQDVILNLGSTIRIIHDRTRNYRDYYVGPNWSLIQIANVDGVAGDEIQLYANGLLRTINDAKGTMY